MRNTGYHGLGNVFLFSEYFYTTRFAETLLGFFANTTQGGQGLANAIAVGEVYTQGYKLKSFFPLVSAIDGFVFDQAKTQPIFSRTSPIAGLQRCMHLTPLDSSRGLYFLVFY